MSAYVAEFESVSKNYPLDLLGRKSRPAVAGVSLQVRAGETLALLGPNRAGKTTLVKMLLSLCRPSAGQVRRFGRPVADRQTLARCGYMHENHAFPRHHSPAELLRFYGALGLVPPEELGGRVTKLLNRVGLADRADEPIARFSKGMVQRLGLAQALVNKPDLLVLDEPTEGLDLEGRHLLREVVGELKAQGRSVLLVSHVLPEVELLADRVAVIAAGRLTYTGPLADLQGRAKAEQGGALDAVLAELYRGAKP